MPADDGTLLHVGVTGDGPDVVLLSGGPGCVQYLEDDGLAPDGVRAWYPEPRGVGRSDGGAHSLVEAVADLEAVRRVAGVHAWTVVGHSWGCDLGVRYAVDHPGSVTRLVGIAGCGVQKDGTWSATYHRLKGREPQIPIAWEPAVHESLTASYVEWIHEPGLLRRLADSAVPMALLAAEHDVRPSWPLQQLAALVPGGTFATVAGVGHDFWATHPGVWRHVVSAACAADRGGRA